MAHICDPSTEEAYSLILELTASMNDEFLQVQWETLSQQKKVERHSGKQLVMTPAYTQRIQKNWKYNKHLQ